MLRKLLVCALCCLVGCSSQDADFFPYAMKGLDAWVFNTRTDADAFAGFVEARYWNRREALVSCASLASEVATAKGWREWSHVCCTVTSESRCETKVR